MPVLTDRNLSEKESTKLLKYKDLDTEISKMRQLKSKTILPLVGALQMTKKCLSKFQGNQQFMRLK